METASDFPSDRKTRDQPRGEERRADRLAEALEENSRLQADRLYLASIVESSHDAIIGVDLKNLVTAWNAAAERIFGYRSDEIVGRPVATLFPPNRRDSELQLIQRVARGETLTHYRTQRVRKDGAILDVSLSLSPIRDADGIIIGASKIVDDVTDEILNERRMRRLEAHRDYLADLVESSNDAIVAGTLDGRIASWNKAAEKMFGYTAGEVVGLSLSVLSPADRRQEADERFQRLMAAGEAIHYETTLLRKDGTPMLTSVAASLVYTRSGEVRGASAIMRDITEERATEERFNNLQAELIHLSRWNTMGMMASTLAHELNQPLTAAVNYVRAARRLMDVEKPELPRIGEFLDKAVGETKLAGGIIRSLRDFIDKRETPRAPEDLNQVTEEAISLSGVTASDSAAHLQTSFAPALPPILMDKIQVEQVLLNLIRNAMDATRDQPERKLVIETAPGEPGFVVVSVIDNGPGIAPAIASQLFQPFITTKEKGMGVGLTICQSIIEGHGGRIWAEQNQPAGTIFRFQLPLGDPIQ
ncbi:MAG TPA: PAS domain S-box protein [Rhizomicrobium sp.]|nr:PAS domain S-box protein [Rhizomicrobium sp.]